MDQLFSLPYEHLHRQILGIFVLLVPVFTQIGRKNISHQHMSHEGKALGKWEHPDVAVSQLNIER